MTATNVSHWTWAATGFLAACALFVAIFVADEGAELSTAAPKK